MSQSAATPFEGDDLDPAACLDYIVAQRATADRAEANVLAAAAHWADLHPVLSGVLPLPGGPGRLGPERLAPLAGPGTPEVAEFAPADLAAALGITTEAGRALIGDALELRHRLPRLWERVQTGTLPAWRARRVAQTTKHLPLPGAAQVDRHVAPFADRVGPTIVDRLATEAMARFDPAQATADRERASDARQVSFYLDQVGLDGTCEMTATLDHADALVLDHTLDQVADHLATLGDVSGHQARRATALGTLADPQTTLNLLGTDHSDGTRADLSVVEQPATPAPRHPRPQLVLHVHLSQTALGDDTAIGRLEGHGPLLASQIKEWVARDDLKLVVKPVIDLNGHLQTDAYEIPHRITELVDLRDTTCAFPWCAKPARSHRRKRRSRSTSLDHDHITAYDPTGPPGQTSTPHLAPLCRTHHRIKTFGTWTYQMIRPGAYAWTNTFGTRWLVDGTGTHALDP